MADFRFNLLTHTPDTLRNVSAALGNEPDNKFTTKTDVGKFMKMGTKSNYVITQAGDEIEGYLYSVRGDTVNEGFSFGAVTRGGRFQGVVGEPGGEEPAVALQPLDYVVSGVQEAEGVKGPGVVIKGTPTRHMWRVIQVIGDGLPGSTVILERDE